MKLKTFFITLVVIAFIGCQDDPYSTESEITSINHSKSELVKNDDYSVELKLIKFTEYFDKLIDYTATYTFSTSDIPEPIEVVSWYAGTDYNNLKELGDKGDECTLLFNRGNTVSNLFYIKVTVRDADGELHSRLQHCTLPKKCFLFNAIKPPSPITD